MLLIFFVGVFIWGFEDFAHPKTEYVKYSDPNPSIQGNGSFKNPYQISHPAHLEFVRDNLSSHFKLTRDLDLEENENFKPIGSKKRSFEGTFDGGGKIIRNLQIQRSDEDHVGFFGWVERQSVIRNVRLKKIDIQGKRFVGGLVGQNYGTIERSHAMGKVVGKNLVGGLVGWNIYDGMIESSYATGKVEGEEYSIGGLVGVNAGKIKTSYAIGQVNGDYGIGSLVGYTYGTIEGSYAKGQVNGNDIVGGLVGSNGLGGKIETSYTTGQVNGKYFIGGLAGANIGMIKTSYATGQVNGNDIAGGFVGLNEFGTIKKSYATGKVNGKELVGGFVGWNNEEGRIGRGNYWITGSAKNGIGRNDGKVLHIIEDKPKIQIDPLIRKEWKNEDMWVFALGRNPRLFWEKLKK